MTETQQHRMAGFTTEQTECDACGRMELRGTVIVLDENGEHVANYGTTCAGRKLGVKITRADALAAEARRRAEVLRELQLASRATDPAQRAMYLVDARRIGLLRADEQRFAAKLEA